MAHTIGWYLPLAIAFLNLTAAFFYGDWMNWKKYYPTILFTICINFAIGIITYNFSLWQFEKAFLNPNHTIADFTLKFIDFPAIILTYLSRYPSNSRLLKQILYITIWTVVFSLLEGFSFLMKTVTYHNGWKYWWSVLVWIAMFAGLRLHYTKPLYAWILFVIGTSFLVWYFHIPILKLK